MSKKVMFVQLVQTFVLARVATASEYREHDISAVDFAVSCVATAQRIDEHIIPDDVEGACNEFMHYMDRTFPEKERPSWWLI